MDWPSIAPIPPPVLTPWSRESLGDVLSHTEHGVHQAGTNSWGTNLARFYPFMLARPALARQLLFLVGGTANGNIDIGIYDAGLHLIVSSGLTAQGTINTVQELNIADTWLAPGRYWLAATCTGATGTGFSEAISDEVSFSMIPAYTQQLGAGAALPATATPVLSTETSPHIFAIGVQFAPVF